MKDVIGALKRLDGIDRRLRVLEKELAAFPGEAEEARRRVAAALAEVRGLDEEIKRAKLSEKGTEGEIAKNADEIRRLNGQLGSLKDQRSYDAMLGEIRTLKDKNDLLSDGALEMTMRCEEMEERRKALRAELPALERERDAALAAIEARRQEVEGTAAGLRDERGEPVAALPAAVLARYEKLLASKEGPAVARIERDACEVCYRGVPPQRIIEIRKLDKLVSCEGCGRILICE
ncbi:MAG: hypothetical protein EHM19_02125 [Candidatus Latescibacterota bacterium]|nr:MAG: hypothetical protein EHM19_02125 [Candidatus Latescibacterota bacterium]